MWQLHILNDSLLKNHEYFGKSAILQSDIMTGDKA